MVIGRFAMFESGLPLRKHQGAPGKRRCMELGSKKVCDACDGQGHTLHGKRPSSFAGFGAVPVNPVS